MCHQLAQLDKSPEDKGLNRCSSFPQQPTTHIQVRLTDDIMACKHPSTHFHHAAKLANAQGGIPSVLNDSFAIHDVKLTVGQWQSGYIEVIGYSDIGTGTDEYELTNYETTGSIVYPKPAWTP